MQTTELQSIFNTFNSKRIAIIGDVMIDSYLWGKADRISPEAPVPVVSVTKRESRMGGAANVAINIKSLGATPIMLAIIGDDEKGREFLHLMGNLDIDSTGILVDANRKTTVKHRIIASTQHLLRVDDELSTPLNQEQEQAFAKHCISVLSANRPDAIVFEDYDKGNLTPFIIEALVAFALENGIPTLVDPKKRNFDFYKHVTLFKPNFKELVEGIKIEGLPKDNPNAIFEAANNLRNKLQATYVLVTLSEHGVLITNGDSYFHMPAQKNEISDVSGAGDTVISVVSLALSCGLAMDKMATIANIAGGLVCEKPGVVPVDKEQLLRESINYFNGK
ncbi:MAG: PfkB family carbohydrate kinase [Salinivirgaceae bacterium]|nr:PfkB family carbohydrate kinase [Salinivirgaceae bacterium]MDD4747654.1 PfkB family carbohydrate kinase [Salinivirgaceae bacterium]MDY0281579.1 PfkB family carbohydrate kinase [Salinivirgaceae bacterium]